MDKLDMQCYAALEERLAGKGIDVEAVKRRLKAQ